jgi:hypothetical protein
MDNIIKLKDTPQGQSRALGKHFANTNESISGGAVEKLVNGESQSPSGLSVRALDALIEAENTLQKISSGARLAIDKEQALLNAAAMANKAIENISTHLEGVNVDDVKSRRIRYLEAALQDALNGLDAAEEIANAYQIYVPESIRAPKKTVQHALGENARLANKVMGGE